MTDAPDILAEMDRAFAPDRTKRPPYDHHSCWRCDSGALAETRVALQQSALDLVKRMIEVRP